MTDQWSQPRGREPEALARGAGQVPGPSADRGAPIFRTDPLERCLQELVRYYRHSTAGRLVTGLVHQMNTPLQVLSFQLELLGQKAAAEPAILEDCVPAAAGRLATLHDYHREKIRQCRAELERLQALTRRLLLQGVHEGAGERRPLDLNQIVADQLELYLAQPFFKHRVKREIQLQPGLPPVYGHYLDFSQSVRNLLDNALEAMEDSVRRELTVATSSEGGRLIFTLSDTGPGIAGEAQSLIFQPFFTTKRDHAGLGLFMVRRLLAPYGGAVRLDSAPGATRVTVSFPV